MEASLATNSMIASMAAPAAPTCAGPAGRRPRRALQTCCVHTVQKLEVEVSAAQVRKVAGKLTKSRKSSSEVSVFAFLATSFVCMS